MALEVVLLAPSHFEKSSQGHFTVNRSSEITNIQPLFAVDIDIDKECLCIISNTEGLPTPQSVIVGRFPVSLKITFSPNLFLTVSIT